MIVDAAISTFRTDDAVVNMVQRLYDEAWPVRRIFVVDSLGKDDLSKRLAVFGKRVVYHNATQNLGSAGNLACRLRLAADANADAVLALNHDATLSKEAVQTLVKVANKQGPSFGALYPLPFYPLKGFYGLTGVRDFPMRRWGTAEPPAEPLVPVTWSTSNGALYGLAPVRERGLCPEGSLWMGWEDYLYGLQLKDAGYTQFIVTDARIEDPYEFKRVALGPVHMTLNDKPTWYLYYSVRNMLRIVLYEAPSPARVAKVGVWLSLMLGQIFVNSPRSGVREALRCFSAGMRDGLKRQGGRWQLPLAVILTFSHFSSFA